MAAPPPPQQALMDELVEQCLLRLPPDDPANFVRAALVCKGWRRIVADRGFGRRFHELHRRPLLLGFLHINTRDRSFFTPMSFFHSGKASIGIGGWHVIDSRHGRVLLSSSPSLYGTLHTHRRSDLAVWNPISGEQLDLPELLPPEVHDWFGFTSKAVLLCASSSACDHLNCHHGPFLVVLLDATCDKVCVHVYSSQVGSWTHITSAAQDGPKRLLPRTPVAVAGNALYFIAHKWTGNGILKYDMGSHDVSWVDLPPNSSGRYCRVLLTTTKSGGLRVVLVEKNSRLHLWSRKVSLSGALSWWVPTGAIELKRVIELGRVIELERVVPMISGSISTVAFVHELGAFFIRTTAGAFTFDPVSKWTRKVHGDNGVNYFLP